MLSNGRLAFLDELVVVYDTFNFFSCSVFQNSRLFGATSFEIIVRNFTPSRQLTGSSPNSTHYEWFHPICILITTTPSSTPLPLLLSLLGFKLPGGGTWSAAACYT